MSTDPRCPACGEKVSATASWCMHCGIDFDEPTDATSRDGEVTIQADRETDGEATVTAAARSKNGTDARVAETARTPDVVEATQHHESPAEAPGLVETVTGGESAEHVLAPLFDAVDRSQWGRLAVVVGFPLAVALLVRSATADLRWLVVTASLLLGVHLLRRVSARETVADGALGAGLLALAVVGFDVAGTALGSGAGPAFRTLADSWPALPVALAAAVAGWSLRE